MRVSATSTAVEPGLSAIGDSFAEWQRGLAQFAFLRLGHNLQSCIAIMGVRNPAELQKVQQDWALQCSSDYQAELGRQAALLAVVPATADDVQSAAALVA